MSELIPLSAVLDKDRSMVPILPFPATYDGEPYTVRGLFGRSAELQAKDGYKVTLRQESIRVNPDHVQWPTFAPAEAPEPQEQEEKKEMPKQQGKPTNRISLAEASELKAKGLKRCWKCKRDMPVAQLNSGGFCRNSKECGAAKLTAVANAVGLQVLSVETPTGFDTVTTVAPASEPLPIKRSVKAKAARRGKKRKYVRKGADAPAGAVLSTGHHKNGHKNGRPSLTFKELVAGARNLKIERDLLRGQVEKLELEKADLYTQLQEILG